MRKLPVTWAVVFAGHCSFLHHLQLVSHDLPEFTKSSDLVWTPNLNRLDCEKVASDFGVYQIVRSCMDSQCTWSGCSKASTTCPS